jgi:hypothetical protein
VTPPSGESPRAGLRKAADSDLHPSTPPIADEPTWVKGGNSTADSVGMPDKDRLVTMEVSIPKSLRKSVKQEAKRRGMTVDEVVADALRLRPSR